MSKRVRREEPSGDEEPGLPSREKDSSGQGGLPVASLTVPSGHVPADGCSDEPTDVPPAQRARNGSSAGIRIPSRVAAQRVESTPVTPDRTDYRTGLAVVLRQLALAERREARERLLCDAGRLGRFRRGLLGSHNDRDAAGQWEGGTDAEELEILRARISEQKQQVDRCRKSLNRPRSLQPDGGPQLTQEEIDEEVWEQRELCNTKLSAVHRDEQELKEREQRLQVERLEHMRQLRAVNAEDSSDFCSLRLLQDRYQLLRLASKCGSLTIYRAYDLVAIRPCGVRVHRMDGRASIEHVSRECESLKQLRHTGLVSLVDSFHHEHGSFITIWESSAGEPLDSYLLRYGPLSEKEARGLVLQLFSTLRFVESRGHQLDCQDLRPSRLTFRGGELKVAGPAILSLRNPDNAHSSSRRTVPLDSCGSTETLEMEDDAIDSSAASAAIRTIGMTLFQALFGRWPEASEAAGLGAEGGCVQIPEQPRVSAECRECLCRLLDRDRSLTVQEAFADPFIAPSRRVRN